MEAVLLLILLAVLLAAGCLAMVVAVVTTRRRSDVELEPPAPSRRVEAPPAPSGRAGRGGRGGARPGGRARGRRPAGQAPFRDRLGKARGLLSGYLGSVRARDKIDEETWDELEEALIRADVGVGATTALLDQLRARVKAEGITTGRRAGRRAQGRPEEAPGHGRPHPALRARAPQRVAVRRRQRRRQDHHHRQGRPASRSATAAR